MDLHIGCVLKIQLKFEHGDMLRRTPSIYNFHDANKIVFYPCVDDRYMICGGNAREGFILQDIDNEDKIICFVLLCLDGVTYIRVNQCCFEPEEVSVEILYEYSI